MNNIQDLFIICLNASSKYIHTSINSGNNKHIFLDEVNNLSILFTYYNDIDKFLTELYKERKRVMFVKRFPFSFTMNYKQYKLFAINNAIDIIECLQRRFVTGGSSSYAYSKAKVTDSFITLDQKYYGTR